MVVLNTVQKLDQQIAPPLVVAEQMTHGLAGVGCDLTTLVVRPSIGVGSSLFRHAFANLAALGKCLPGCRQACFAGRRGLWQMAGIL